MNFAELVHIYFRRRTVEFQPKWCRQCWDMKFFRLYILRKLKTWFSQKCNFQNSHSIQQILMNFAGLVHVHFRHLTAKFQLNWWRQCWDMNFVFTSSKTLNVIFSKVHFSKFALYVFIFPVLSGNMPCILLKHIDMGAIYPILWKTQNSYFRYR